MGPSRFGIAVRALAWLAQTGGVIPSASIACQVKSHATFLRRVMLPLVRAGIVTAREGREGGYILNRPPEQISLAEIYLAVKTEETDPGQCAESGGQCSSGKGVELALKEIMDETEELLIHVLRRHSIATLAERAMTLEQGN